MVHGEHLHGHSRAAAVDREDVPAGPAVSHIRVLLLRLERVVGVQRPGLPGRAPAVRAGHDQAVEPAVVRAVAVGGPGHVPELAPERLPAPRRPPADHHPRLGPRAGDLGLRPRPHPEMAAERGQGQPRPAAVVEPHHLERRHRRRLARTDRIPDQPDALLRVPDHRGHRPRQRGSHHSRHLRHERTRPAAAACPATRSPTIRRRGTGPATPSPSLFP